MQNETQVLKEIQDGTFVKEWMDEHKSGQIKFKQMKKINVILSMLAIVVVLTSCDSATNKAKEEKPYEMKKYAKVKLTADITHLSDNQKEMLKFLFSKPSSFLTIFFLTTFLLVVFFIAFLFDVFFFFVITVSLNFIYTEKL